MRLARWRPPCLRLVSRLMSGMVWWSVNWCQSSIKRDFEEAPQTPLNVLHAKPSAIQQEL
jgi:hypothetical protein